MKELTEEEIREVARQLQCPEGEEGIKVAEFMIVNNAKMISRAIDLLEVVEQDRILELGPGNAGHVDRILQDRQDVTYVGADISDTMIDEAIRINLSFVDAGVASFEWVDGLTLPFHDETFSKIMTVNTLYFWKDPEEVARELVRVLKPGGFLILVFADKKFMEKLPFTRYGFHLYDRSAAEALLVKAGFVIEAVYEEVDIVSGRNLDQPVERDIVLIRAGKSLE